MRVLNLYAGLGGNRKLWTDVDVTAVEMEENIASVYRDIYPNDTLVIGDAHKFLLENYTEFDFIWTSPPCQTHSAMAKATRHPIKKYPDMSLYQQIIFLDNFFNGKYVVENVKPYYDPLIKPSRALGRHYFWSNFGITNFKQDNHPNFIQGDSPEDIESMKQWLGIKYEGNIYYKKNHSPGQILRNCVHPELGLHIFNCMKGTPRIQDQIKLPLF